LKYVNLRRSGVEMLHKKMQNAIFEKEAANLAKVRASSMP
jgi:hypothetical protein